MPDNDAAPGQQTGGSADVGHQHRRTLLADHRAHERERAARQLDQLLAILDGQLSLFDVEPVGDRCPRWCSAMPALDLEYWADLGGCPCPLARRAVAS